MGSFETDSPPAGTLSTCPWDKAIWVVFGGEPRPAKRVSTPYGCRFITEAWLVFQDGKDPIFSGYQTADAHHWWFDKPEPRNPS